MFPKFYFLFKHFLNGIELNWLLFLKGLYNRAQIAALPPLLRSAAIEERCSRRGMAKGAAVEEVVYCCAAVETCTQSYHFLPVSIQYLQCIHCLLHYVTEYFTLPGL